MDKNTTTVSPAAQTAPASVGITKDAACRALGIELAKGDKTHGSFIIVQREDGALEIRSDVMETTVVYTSGQIVSAPSSAAAPALVLRKDSKTGQLKPNAGTPDEAKAQSAQRMAFAVLQLLAITPGSPFTPKGSKSDKLSDRCSAVRESSLAGLRSK